MVGQSKSKGSESEVIEFNELKRQLARERVLKELEADDYARNYVGKHVTIIDIDWRTINGKLYAVAKCYIDEDKVHKWLVFGGRIVTDQLKLAEQVLKKGKAVRCKIELRESRTGRKYLYLI